MSINGISRRNPQKIDVSEETDRQIVGIGDSEDNGAHARVSKPSSEMDFYAVEVQDLNVALLNIKLDELIVIQKGMLKLLEAAFEDGLSGREI